MSDWAKLKVVDLKAELKRRGLPQGGLKLELIARLDEHDAAEPEEPARPQVEDARDVQDGEEDVSHPVNGDTHREQSIKDPGTVGESIKELPVEEPVSEAAPEPTPETQPQPEPTVPSSTQPEPEPEPQLAPVPEIVNDAPPQRLEADSEARPEHEPQPKPEAQPELSPVLAPEPDPQPALELDPKQKLSVPDSQPMDQIHEPPSTTTIAPIESPLEAQKRKRRSASPPPQEQDPARKRPRPDDSFLAKGLTRPDASPPGKNQGIDYDRHVEPSIHPATSALCINNLMRPLRPAELRAHIVNLATPPDSTSLSDEIVTKFHLDFIRTHAFVGLNSISAASRVRQLLHGRVWPNESTRKALNIDFIPPEKIDSWIDMEDAGGGRRPGSRWEVVYTPSPDGSTVEANLVSTSLASSSNRPPPAAASKFPSMDADSVNSAPLGPRGYFLNDAPPTGPRGGPTRSRGYPSTLTPPIGDGRYTRSRPSISYTVVSKDLADRRIRNMRYFYTHDINREMGREFNRYSFEDGDSFVDRGREVFEGIRPPHRERGGGGRGGGGAYGGGVGRSRGGRRGGGGGGGAFRPRSDRYIPGGGRDDDDRRRF
ncbi:hypothetical protein QQS21_012656 [Conoideocrella luteorostrata]|uniref:SAP domain-containing protein n=1 Tax=Conoideocrella luteorostrata TaxID=1105319 RepID=A0AAJ0CAT2_9HYPO|nr:hypothetical protein QQS21_012656 [Conoideocrella luteorostrata]